MEKLIAPCKICPDSFQPRNSEQCSTCKDPEKYADFLLDPEAFKKENPVFQYSFDKESETPEAEKEE